MKKINVAFLLSFALCSLSAHAEEQPYYFSNQLKDAVKDCTPFSEDIFEKNSGMQNMAFSLLSSMFSDKLDLSSAKVIMTVNGKKDEKCSLTMKYDFSFPIGQDLECLLTTEFQNQLVDAMNDTSTESTTKTFNYGFVTTTITARKFDLTMSEMTAKYCQARQPSPEEIKQKEEQMKEKLMAFPEEFKISLMKCEPNKASLKMMGIEMQSVEIVGLQDGKCHIKANDFHTFLDKSELNFKRFDELNDVLADEQKSSYEPTYAPDGLLFSLSVCENSRKYGKTKSDFSQGKFKTSINQNITIERELKSSYANGMCDVLLAHKLTRNGNDKDYSLHCYIQDSELDAYLQKYSDIIQQYGPKMDEFSYSSGRQTDEVSAIDKELFQQMMQNKVCK
ncbi:MAG: hypothetical protein MJ250_08940 [Alphaproteobacteria bacterium]|nr:hypothetical protein [Alphaproteobacteria bacterium]